MARALRKLRKLIRHPGLYFRDYLLMRHPLYEQVDVNRITKHDRVARTKAAAKKPKTITLREIKLDGFIQATFAVDIVYTWVDADNPQFQQSLHAHLRPDAPFKPEATYRARFESRDELRYSLRSITTYAPWVNRIYIVTNGQVPVWLDLHHPKVTVVQHHEIIPHEYLPTFNSHVIESCLHRIPGLSEHYVYFNDDVMLLRPTKPTDFFTENGLSYGFLSRAEIPNGPRSVHDTLSICAAKNARELTFRDYGFYLSPKFAHTFHPQRKSVATDNEQRFAAEFHLCRQNKFRAETDILCCSFLNPCVAYVTGRGVLGRTRAWYFNIRDRSATAYYRSLLRMKGAADIPYSVCLNDHLIPGRQDFPEYADALRGFLEAYYTLPSPFEIRAAEPALQIAAE